MADQNKWKNFEDYNYEDEPQTEEERKREIILSATLPSVTLVLIIIGLWLFKSEVIRLKIYLAGVLVNIRLRLGISTGTRTNISLDPIPTLGRTSIADINAVQSNEIESGTSSSGDIESPPSVRPRRYQATRHLNLPLEERGEIDHRELASQLIRPFFAEPLANFEFGDSRYETAESLEIEPQDFATSTQIQEGLTYTRQSEPNSECGPVIQEDENSRNADTLDLLESNQLMEIELTDASSGSVVEFGDLVPAREQPKRTTRNKVPIYIDPESDEL